MRVRFLSRNRIIAALSRGTVVVEAAVRSGALNTASWTSRLYRPLMGVPGPVTSAPSEGVHQLIRSGAATLVTRADDVLELTGQMGAHLSEVPRAPSTPRDRLSRAQQRVLDAVPMVRPAPADSIARTAGLALGDVRTALEALVCAGLTEQLPTGWRLAEPAQVR
jgi:DNA processing protein